MKKYIIKKLKQYQIILLVYDHFREFYHKRLVSDEKYIKRKFKKSLGRSVELKKPIKYNDKLQWLKLNWYDPIAVKCADKYEVREIVRKRIGEKYLNTLIGVYEDVDDIDIDQLPNKFVLKGTHGSGFNIICTDKEKVDWENEFKKMKRWLRKNFYYYGREWVYKDIKPRIICEEYLVDEEVGQLRDYKIHCFNGTPKFIQIDFDRVQGHKRNVYDLEWNLTDIKSNYENDKKLIVNKPKKLDEMLKLAEKLSMDFPYARVDFYYLEESIIFGEITFFPSSGFGTFDPEEFEVTMGDWLKLPKQI